MIDDPLQSWASVLARMDDIDLREALTLHPGYPEDTSAMPDIDRAFRRIRYEATREARRRWKYR
jgi:hypothetical protein